MPRRQILLVMPLLCLAWASQAVECIDYAQVPVPVGSITFDSPVQDVDVGPSFACVVASDRLFVVDIAQAPNPTQVAALDLSDFGKCITISGSLAFVGEETWVTIIDVGVPSAPVVLGRVDTKEWILGIEVSSPFIYVVAYRSFLIIDISDPSEPTQVASTFIGTSGHKGIALHGEIAYVAAGRLYAVDVRDPLTPTILGSKDLNASDVFIAGGYAYVSTYGYGMAVVDISDPARPVILGSVDTPGDALAVEVAEGMAYLVDAYSNGAFPSALRAIDVSNPAYPRVVGAVDLPGMTAGLAVSGNLAYILSGRSLHVVDTRDLVSTAVLAQMDTPGFAEAAAASGDFVYVADHGRGVHVIDSRDPQMPRIVGSVDTPGQAAQDIVVSDTHAYVADGEHGLQVLDIRTPSAPTLIATLDTPTAAERLTLDGHYVYVADLGELLVIDIATPSSPVLIGSLDMHVTSLDVEGDYAFAGIGSRLHMIRITDPFAPRSVTYMPLSWFVDDIQVTNGVAYVANGLGGFLIVDLQNPFAPVVIGGFDWDRSQTRVGRVQVEGAHAYLTDGAGLHVLDISRPASPVLLRSFALDKPRDLLLHAGQVYIPGWNSGLFVLRPQCRPTAVTLEDFRLEHDGESVVARWRCGSVPTPDFRLAASSGSDSWDVPIESSGAGIWEARDRSPHLRRLDAVDYRLYAREQGEDWVFLAQERIALSAFQEGQARLSVYPNPLAGEGRIRYEVGAPQQLRVSVHDVNGRLVRRLLDGLVDAKRGEILWDGLDTNGRTVAAGVYMVRLESPSVQRSLKLVMAR